MKQITQRELIEIIEEKQKNANIAYEQSQKDYPCYATKEKEVVNKAYIECYQEIIRDLNDIEIVAEKPDLAVVYSGVKVCVHTKERIMGSRTPFTARGIIEKDDGKNIILLEEYGGKVIIDKEGIVCIERMPDLNDMLDKAPITPYIEPKIEPIRNDRFREFDRGNKCTVCKINIDAKEVSNIIIETTNASFSTIEIDVCGKNVLKQGYANDGIDTYNDLIEWWKYWKQM